MYAVIVNFLHDLEVPKSLFYLCTYNGKQQAARAIYVRKVLFTFESSSVNTLGKTSFANIALNLYQSHENLLLLSYSFQVKLCNDSVLFFFFFSLVLQGFPFIFLGS